MQFPSIARILSRRPISTDSSSPPPYQQGPHRQWFVTIIFLVCAVVIIAREPLFFIHPRFWAEEGRVFFKFAYLHDALTGLLYVPRKITAYFLLCATLPTTLASRLPLEEAPTVTTFFCAFFMLGVFAVILYGRSYVWNRPYTKVITCGILMTAAVLAREAWLNTINLQLFCGILAICLLTEDLRNGGRIRRYLYRTLVLFCGLSGLYAVATLPAFLLKAAWEKSRESRVLAFLLGICTVIQGSIYLYLRSIKTIHVNKTIVLPIQHQAFLVFFHHLLIPVLGRENAYALLKFFDIARSTVSYKAEPPVVLAGWIALLFYLLLVYGLFKMRRNRMQGLLLIAFLGVTALTIYGASFGVPSERYSVVPFFAFAVLLLNTMPLPIQRPWLSRRTLPVLPPALLLGLALIGGTHNYTHILDSATYTPEAPRWRQEIREWRRHPHKPISIFPHPYWTFSLPDLNQLREVNEKLSALRGSTIHADQPITFSDAALRDISWEVITYVTLESDIPLDTLDVALYLAGPDDRFVFRDVTTHKDGGGKRHRLTFSLAVDPRSDDPDLLERFRHVETLGMTLSAHQQETLTLTSISVSCYHRKALVYF